MRLRNLIPAFLTLSTSLGASATPHGYTALVLPNGKIQINQYERSIATIGFGMQTDGWMPARIEAVRDNVSLPQPAKAVWSTGSADLTTDVQSQNGILTVTIRATPVNTVHVLSSRVSLEFPAWKWVGGSAAIGNTTIPLPDFLGNYNLYDSPGTSATFRTAAGTSLTMTQARSRTTFVDLRQWLPEFECALGNNGFEDWQQGQTKQWVFTLSMDQALDLQVSQQLVITQGEDWIPLQLATDVTPHSALDWRPSHPQTAGSLGWLKVTPNGQFAFEAQPTKPVRFYGVCLSGDACVLDRDVADRLANRLSSVGYNAVRIIIDEVLLDNRAGTSTVIDPVKLDKVNYLIYALGQVGIYVKVELYVSRTPKNDEVWPGPINEEDYKALLLFNNATRLNWLGFARNLMNSNNPYTGCLWKNDPRIPWVAVTNENSVASLMYYIRNDIKAAIVDLYHQAGNQGEFSAENDVGARFGASLNVSAYRWMKAQLDAIGVKALVSDSTGGWNQAATSLNRCQLDFVENHYYWDHAVFTNLQWREPSQGSDAGESWMRMSGGTLNRWALGRIAKKPFIVGEFAVMAPNRFRADEALIMGAAAAIQQWDGVFRHAWAHTHQAIISPNVIHYINAQSDPLQIASDRAIVALYLKAHLSVFAPKLVWKVDRNAVGAPDFDAPMKDALFTAPIATSFDFGDPTGASPFARSRNFGTRFGEVVGNPDQGTMSVRSPKTCAVIAEPGQTVVAGQLTMTPSLYRAVVYATSLDDKPLTVSRRFLVAHLTDLQNSNTTFQAPDRVLMTYLGDLPLLARNGTADVRLRLMGLSGVHVYRLDMAGNRIQEMQTSIVGSDLLFTCTVQGPQGATMYYEVVKD